MIFSDVVDVLLAEHDEIRRLCSAVERSGDRLRGRRFAVLSHAVHLHESGEQAIIHLVVRDLGAAAGLIATMRLAEETALLSSLGTLDDLGAGDPDFARRFAVLHRAILEHLTREELDEFPILRRRVVVQRLQGMSGELSGVQLVAAT
ncbi:hemerythrin domain-containing protein [Actinoplanes utahensis]|uniref:Hemerythrin-like domain-containing protein n=1 Tax=Actinoplanes utahensis TaxID=1869 RepID=A0A0A6UA55_ACTUT|nr:hemerythrin domain-containing protein [Actinoplanes utahensis]KHD72301.1 hypothetical protein MB27_37985 [Actinoplanes utahensis]GIF29659.1 hypothetical protein Aut01nite_26450 [Actinoplanes utahensis]